MAIDAVAFTGNSLNSVLIGNSGNDALTDNSTTSNDIYRWGVGQGNDTINDAGGSADRIEIGAGVVASQVTLTRSGNHLLVGITGASDVLTVSNWYVGTANRIEEIRLADGTVVGAGAAPLSISGSDTLSERMARLADPTMRAPDDSMVNSAQSLIQAMAQFDAVDGAESTWRPWERHDPLPMMLVASW